MLLLEIPSCIHALLLEHFHYNHIQAIKYFITILARSYRSPLVILVSGPTIGCIHLTIFSLFMICYEQGYSACINYSFRIIPWEEIARQKHMGMFYCEPCDDTVV